MEIYAITNEQLMEAAQHINLIKFKTASNEFWTIAPVLYTTLEGMELVVDCFKSKCTIKTGDEIILKFQNSGFEYLVSGEIENLTDACPSNVSVRYKLAQRYFNQRKHARFDTDLKVTLKTKLKDKVKSKAKNISRGGAMIMSEEELEEGAIINIQVPFPSGNLFTTDGKIMRKFRDNSGMYGYGVQFIGVSHDNSKIINREISCYENEYFKSLTVIRDSSKKGEMRFDTKIAIFSYGQEESYSIREELVKLGAENFEVYHNFRFASDFFSEEQPQTVIIDADNLEQQVLDTVNGINDSFPQVKMLLLLPMDFAGNKAELDKVPSTVDILFRPLICGEFEDGIMKYLL